MPDKATIQLLKDIDSYMQHMGYVETNSYRQRIKKILNAKPQKNQQSLPDLIEDLYYTSKRIKEIYKQHEKKINN